jgi:glycosyltransferase involved in cell wall biosynthesis
MTRRILFLAWAPFFSGAERALLLTLRSLDPARYQPIVLAGTDGEFVEQVRALGLPCETFTLGHLDRRNPVPGLLSIAAVLRVARRDRVSLIHANETASFQPGGYAARVLGVPAVAHVRFPDKASGFRWFFRTPFSQAFFVSRALLESARVEAPDLFSGRSQVLHDCVEPQPVWSAEDIARERRALGLPERRTIVALTGQIAEVKGIWDFVQAATVLTHTDTHFAVLGDDLRTHGALRVEMETRVRALGLANQFTFLGFRKEAPRLVQAFDMIAVPSHVEPLGNATLEAMAAGRPVVGSRVGGIPEMVVHGETGLLVPPADPQALAAAIARLAEDHGMRSRMSTLARQRSLQTFGMLEHGRLLQTLYDRLCLPAAFLAAESSLA